MKVNICNNASEQNKVVNFCHNCNILLCHGCTRSCRKRNHNVVNATSVCDIIEGIIN